MFDQNQPEVRFAIETVRNAALLVRHIQQEMVTDALTKGDRSPVTVADYAAQAFVGHALDRSFSQDALVGEEDSTVLQTGEQVETLARITAFVSEYVPEANPNKVCTWIDRGSAETASRFWTVDPIDGTKGFLRGDQYAVALALVIGGQVQIGVLGCPNLTQATEPDPAGLGTLVIAVRGQGTWATPLQGKESYIQLRVSTRTDPTQARLMRSFESGHTNVGKIGELVAALQVQAEPVSMDSQAKYAVMAAGTGEILVRLLSEKQPDYREKIWDQAAGALVVEEAGGRITDLHGNPLDFTRGRTLANNRGVLASNGYLHDTVLTALVDIGV